MEKQSIRQQILEQAIKCTTQDRNKTYGHPKIGLQLMADLVNAYFKTNFTMADMAMIMVFGKISRIFGNKIHLDNNTDGAAYLAIQGELQSLLEGENDA